MSSIEIYFDDFTDEKQYEIMEEFGIEDPEEMNWDLFPMFVLPVPDTVEEDEFDFDY